MRSQALSIKTIIVAGIGLVVMVIVILIFTGNMRSFNRSAQNCEAHGGDCVASIEVCREVEQGTVLEEPYNKWCEENREGAVCCLST